MYRQDLFIPFRRYFNDKHEPGYNKRLKQAREGYFDGYWGNEGYFKEIRPVLVRELQLKETFKDEQFLKMQSVIEKTNSVAIHIRRGDYVSNERFSKIFNQLSPDYYVKAIETLSGKLKDPVFYFFSDDKDWVKANFLNNPDYPYCLIDQQVGGKDYLEFALMKSCRHFIIANSTFSWWAAWLGQENDTIVISPSYWYHDKERQRKFLTQSFIPENWLSV